MKNITNITIAINKLSKNLDTRIDKLCDKIKDLQLSQKRKNKALFKIQDICNDKYITNNAKIEKIYNIAQKASFCNERKNSKPLKTIKSYIDYFQNQAEEKDKT